MKLVFEPGDKLYKNKYTPEEYFKFRTDMIIACVYNNWHFYEEPYNDYSEILALTRDGFDNDFDMVRDNKINLMDVLKELILTRPIVYKGYYFDCDFKAVIRMRALVDYMKRNNILTVNWVDTRNMLQKDVPLEIFEGILKKYADRVYELNAICFEIVYEMDKSKSVEELSNVSFNKLYDMFM